MAHQVYYSLVGRDYEWELMPLGMDQGVGALIWSPLGWGRLTGKIRRGQPLPEVSRLHKTAEKGPQVADEYLYRVVDALEEIAGETGKTVPQIALNWLLQRPTVSSVIIGARNEEQLRQNLGAAGWNLRPNKSPGSTKPAKWSRPTLTGTSGSSPIAIQLRCGFTSRDAASSSGQRDIVNAGEASYSCAFPDPAAGFRGKLSSSRNLQRAGPRHHPAPGLRARLLSRHPLRLVGVIASLEYQSHQFVGQWFDH